MFGFLKLNKKEDKLVDVNELKEEALKEERFDDISSINDIPVNVSVVVGKTKISIENLLKLGKGSVFELDRQADEPVDILVNNKLIAKGEIVVLDEGQLGVAILQTFKAN